MILLGSLIAHLKDVSYEEFEKTLLDELKNKIKKNPELKDLNLNALKEGINLAEKFDAQKNPFIGKDEKELKNEYSKEKIKWQRFPEYCKGCGLCITRCPVKALSFSKDLGFLGNPLPIIDMEKCIGCGMCMKTCPDAAIEVKNSAQQVE